MKKKECFITAEDFLSVFFMRKYGLKSLAINSTVNFLKSSEGYAQKNSMLSLFLKILKNKIEESFFEVHHFFLMNLNRQLPELFKKSMKNGTPLIGQRLFE